MNLSNTSTAFTIDGHKTVKTLGMVSGISVRSRSIFGTIGAYLQTLLGGDISLMYELCEQARHDAFAKMRAQAEELGANAVIGVRYEATKVIRGVTEVICYGTAVVIEQM